MKLSNLVKKVLTNSLSRNLYENSITGKAIRHSAKMVALGLALTFFPTKLNALDDYFMGEKNKSEVIEDISEIDKNQTKSANFNDKEYFEYVEKLPVSDPFSAPNIHILEGRNKHDYYGSGDVNDDELINQEDADLIKNNQIISEMKDRADVNGDGIVNSEDAKLIEDYFNGNKNFLPGHWNELNLQPNRRELKLDWLNKMLAIDKTDENPYRSYYNCDEFTKQVLINFTGIENFENYDQKEFYESYGAFNARFNIPIYELITNSPGGTHASCIVYLGPEDDSEKDDIFEKGMNENQWYKFEPQTDKEHDFGEGFISENGPAIIKGFSYNEYYSHHTNSAFLQFELENGIAKLKKDRMLPNGGVGTIFEYIEQGGQIYRVLENPWHLDLEYKEKPEKISYEVGTDSYPKSGEIKEMKKNNSEDWESNTEYYQNRIKERSSFSNFEDVNPNFDYYEYDYTQKDSVFFSVGRHDFSDVRKYDVEVRDTKAPVFIEANADGELASDTVGYWSNGNDLDIERTGGLPEVIDNSDLSIDLEYNTTLEGTDGRYEKWRREFIAKDKSINENTSYAYKNIYIDSATPTNEFESLEKMVAYPNPTRGKVNFNYNGNFGRVNYEVYDITGKMIDMGSGDYNMGDKINLDISDKSPGQYIIQLTTEGNTESYKVVKQ
jgi:hypothetical protein